MTYLLQEDQKMRRDAGAGSNSNEQDERLFRNERSYGPTSRSIIFPDENYRNRMPTDNGQLEFMSPWELRPQIPGLA